MNIKHSRRFFGGLGSIILIYLPIRLLENKPGIFIIILLPLMSYVFGWLLEHETCFKEFEKK